MLTAKKALATCVVLCFCLAAFPAYADKSSVEIDATGTAAKGATIKIKLNVKHHGNSFLHYTSWVYVKVNNVEVARWDFSASSRPEGDQFSREVEYAVDGPAEIEAEASCNLHGSAGKARHKVEAR